MQSSHRILDKKNTIFCYLYDEGICQLYKLLWENSIYLRITQIFLYIMGDTGALHNKVLLTYGNTTQLCSVKLHTVFCDQKT